MQSAKEHVGKFLHGSGKHTTDLHTHQNAAVTHETVKSTEEENVTKAVDREIHETHHQTEVQPIHDREVRSTEHHHNVMPVENRHQTHGRDNAVKEKLSSIAGAFGDKQHVEETKHVQGDQSEIVGEHHHHHIHHTVQPVVKKETIQPHVVHTTVPVHERVDIEPTVHSATVAKPLSMDQFKQQVGVGGADRHETIQYQGDPLNISKDANVQFDHRGNMVNPSHQSSSSTGLTSGGIGGTTGGVTGDHHHSQHGGTGTGTASAGATAAAMAASHRHNDRDPTGTNTASGLGGIGGRGNDYQQSSTGQGQTIGSAANTLGGRDHTSSHHQHNTTDGSRSMPGEYVQDTGNHSGSSNIPRTAGYNTTSTTAGTGSASNPTGFIDGRSPNDNKADTEEKPGLISGLINKMKS